MLFQLLLLFLVFITACIKICNSQQPQQQNANLSQLCLFHSNYKEFKSHPERVSKVVSNVPRKIWQTYKTDVIPSKTQQFVGDWLEMNPEYTYNFLNQGEISGLIAEQLETEMFQIYNQSVLFKHRSDFVRILILYMYGGIYVDLDLKPIRPIREWRHYPFDKCQLILSVGSSESLQQQVVIASRGHLFLAELLRLYHDTLQHDDDFMRQNPQIILNYGGPLFWSRGLLNFCGINPQIEQKSFKYGDFISNEYNKLDSQLRKCCDQNQIVIEDNRQLAGQFVQYMSKIDKWKDCSQNENCSQYQQPTDVRQMIRKYRKDYTLYSEQQIMNFDFSLFNQWQNQSKLYNESGKINEIVEFMQQIIITKEAQSECQMTIPADEYIYLLIIILLVICLLLLISTVVLAIKLSSKNKQLIIQNLKNLSMQQKQEQEQQKNYSEIENDQEMSIVSKQSMSIVTEQ